MGCDKGKNNDSDSVPTEVTDKILASDEYKSTIELTEFLESIHASADSYHKDSDKVKESCATALETLRAIIQNRDVNEERITDYMNRNPLSLADSILDAAQELNKMKKQHEDNENK